ncbi:MAG: hypothetical protein JW913_14535 [Chitinispirillaceae bacterium]|nr:hypothetical protein [Chitinispirillaceae bacterium]
MDFVDGKYGLVAGSDNSIATTDDGCTTWHQRPTDKAVTICAVSPVEIWITDKNVDGVVYHTIDSGNTWVKKDIGSGDIIRKIVFYGNRGYVVGDSWLAYRTTDGGESWKDMDVSPAADFVDVEFPDSSHGWVIGSNMVETVIAQSADGGETWSAETLPVSIRLYDICAPDSLTMYTIGNDTGHAFIYYTLDGGKTWNGGTDSIPGSNHRWIHFIDKNRGFVFTTTGIMYTTTDGGHTWPDSQSLGFSCRAVDFTTGGFVWILSAATGGISLYQSKDTCRTWTYKGRETAITNKLYEVSFADPSHGTMVTDSTYYITGDGGSSWEKGQLPDSVQLPLARIAMPAAGALRIISTRYQVYAKNSPGGEWYSSDLPEFFVPRDYVFLGTSHGWILGGVKYWERGSFKNVSLVATTDDAQTWHEIWSDSTVNTGSICFIDDNTGWMTGASGYLMHTTDGGETWSKKDAVPVANYTDVCFLDDRNGWLLAEYDTAYQTSDGGATWKAFYLGSYQNNYIMSKMSVCDSSHIIIAGTRRYNRFAADPWYYSEVVDFKAGVSRNLLLSRSQQDISFNFAAVSDTLIWVVGNNGLVQRYSQTSTPITSKVIVQNTRLHTSPVSYKYNIAGSTLRINLFFDMAANIRVPRISIFDLKGRCLYTTFIRHMNTRFAPYTISVPLNKMGKNIYICTVSEKENNRLYSSFSIARY